MSLPLLTGFEDVKGFLTGLGVVQARLMPMFLLIPFMNRSMVPRTIAFGFAAGIGLLVVPILPVKLLPEGPALVGLLVKEAAIGLLLGFLAAIPFWMIELVGFVIDNQRGASMAATINPMTGHDSSPLGMLMAFAFITFYFAAGGMELLLGLVFDSYRLWPPLEFWPNWGSPDFGTLVFAQLNRLMLTGLLLAAPVLLAMFLSELGLALVSRFAPQLQVFFLAMPIKSALGLLVLVFYAATLFDYSYEPMRESGGWVRVLDPLLRGR